MSDRHANDPFRIYMEVRLLSGFVRVARVMSVNNGAAAAAPLLPDGVNPENNHIGGGPFFNTNRFRNNNNQNPLFNVRDRLVSKHYILVCAVTNIVL